MGSSYVVKLWKKIMESCFLNISMGSSHGIKLCNQAMELSYGDHDME